MILLSGFLEGLFGFIVTIGGLMLLFGGFQWIMAKFFGTHFHGKFQGRQAMQEHHNYELIVKEYARTNPNLFKNAVERCKKKGYSKTHFNVLSEIRKIEREQSEETSISDKIAQKIKSVNDQLKFNSSDSTINKLEKLNKLRKEGGLSQEEYDDFKNTILNKNQPSDRPNTNDKFNKKDTTTVDFSEMQTQHEIRKAIQTINSLYFEYKNDLDCLRGMDLTELHDIIMKNEKTVQVINSYDNLYKLYSSGLVDDNEFLLKKKQIIINSLKP